MLTCVGWMNGRKYDLLASILQDKYDDALANSSMLDDAINGICLRGIDYKYQSDEYGQLLADHILPCSHAVNEFLESCELTEMRIREDHHVLRHPCVYANKIYGIEYPRSNYEGKSDAISIRTSAAYSKQMLKRKMYRLRYEDMVRIVYPDNSDRITLDNATSKDDATTSGKLLSLYTNNSINSKLPQCVSIVIDTSHSINEKLYKIDTIMPIPPFVSAQQLANVLDVSKTAIIKTEWWKNKRKGEKRSEVAKRKIRITDYC